MALVLTPLALAVLPIALPPRADLVAAAAATNRPAECATGAAEGLWTSARSPALRRYCLELSRALARLSEDPASAKAAAERAEALAPKRAAPKLILARLAAAAGDSKAALARFEAALAIDPRAADAPAAMHDLASSYRRQGKLAEALATYRALVPRSSLLRDREQRASVLLEAAQVAMSAPADQEPRRLDEALAYLREATRDPHHALRDDVTLSLVVALDLAGRHARADAVLGEVYAEAWARHSPAAAYLVDRRELDLLLGLALEASAASEARAAYERYLAAAPSAPATALARRRLAALTPRSPTRRGPR
ncbi:MAG: hypothetical protein R3B72_22800 [Polyangiaceae bacterium]